jgi:hypothetical protein
MNKHPVPEVIALWLGAHLWLSRNVSGCERKKMKHFDTFVSHLR